MDIYKSKEYCEDLHKISSILPGQNTSFLVTGATGLIGSCIVDSLLYANNNLDQNYSIYVMGRDRKKLEERFSYAQNSKNFYILEQNIQSPISEQFEVDYIIHAASNADPRSYALYPSETILTNIYGTNNILYYCMNHLSTRMVLLSSFEVYGYGEESEYYSESQSGYIDFNKIRACYPESKRCAELLVRCYFEQYQINCVIARLCSIYGPTMSSNDSKAHAQFIRNALNGENIVLKSEGKPKRSYCYVVDAVLGLFTVLFNGCSGEVYNIANKSSVATIAEVARAVADISDVEVVFALPDTVEEKGFSTPKDTILNSEKLEKLNWTGKYSLKEGLQRTIAILKDLSM